MKKSLLLLMLTAFLFHTSQAQFGGIFKKKKDKQETSANDSTTNNNDKNEEHKKESGSFFGKILGKVSKMAGNMSGMVATAENLNDVDITSSLGTNIYPKDLGLILTDFLKGDYIDHGDITVLTLSSKDGLKFYKYAGIIKDNGKEIKHLTMGVHAIVDQPKSGNKKITFEKDGRLEGSFTIPAPKNNVKLVSINGQKSNVTLDLSKDLTLELENYSTEPDVLIRVDLVVTIIGIRTMLLVTYVKPAPTVVIPAAAFKHMETSGGFGVSNSYLAISDQSVVKTVDNTGFFRSPFDCVTGSNDGMWVKAINQPTLNKGFKIEEKFEVNGNKMEVTAEKKNAAFSMPLSFAKKISVVSMSMSGNYFLETMEKDKMQGTEFKRTIQFPEVPHLWHEVALKRLYDGITNVITNEVQSSKFLPDEVILNAPSFPNVQKFFKEDESSSTAFSQSYKGMGAIVELKSYSVSIKGETALLKETGADALLKVKMVLELNSKNKSMTPYLTIEMDGDANGGFRSLVGNTKYFTMKIKGKPFPIKEGSFEFTPEDYSNLVQIDDFMEAFKQALHKINTKENETKEYEEVWKSHQ